MKKLLILLVFATLALASCKKDKPGPYDNKVSKHITSEQLN